jgi:hypothetical protein
MEEVMNIQSLIDQVISGKSVQEAIAGDIQATSDRPKTLAIDMDGTS